MKIYLAIPYSWNPKFGYALANEVAAKLMQDGHVVFSPISHSHVISDWMDESLRTSWDFWKKQDVEFLTWADEVWVIDTGNGTIETSVGVQFEIEFAQVHGKPVKRIIYSPFDDNHKVENYFC